MTDIDAKKQKKDFVTISNFRDKNEKASWLRKKANLESIVDKLEPIEDEIRKLQQIKMDMIDELQEIRKTMIVDCIHPQDYLVHYGKFVKCRFCETNISIPRKV